MCVCVCACVCVCVRVSARVCVYGFSTNDVTLHCASISFPERNIPESVVVIVCLCLFMFRIPLFRFKVLTSG